MRYVGIDNGLTGMATTTCDSKIYVSGGFQCRDNQLTLSSLIREYDPNTNSMVEFGLLRKPRSHHVMTCVQSDRYSNKTLLVCGGYEYKGDTKLSYKCYENEKTQ